MKIEEVEALITPEGHEFLREHCDDNAEQFLLKYRGKVSDNLIRGVAEQLSCRRRFPIKQPRMAEVGALAELSVLEQSTPQRVAEFRKSVLSGKSLCECTGGLGVDTIALAEVFESVTFCEIDPARAALFKYNSSLLNIENVSVQCGDSMDFLRTCPPDSFDWLFLDPARRDGSGKRFISLDACMPNVIEEADLLRQSAKNIAIKLSPAFEISELPKIFPDLSRCMVISLYGEVREILITIEEGVPVQPVESVALSEDKDVRFEDDFAGAVLLADKTEDAVLFEPDPASIKAGLIDRVAREYSLRRWSRQGIFLLSESVIPDFPGRQFKILAVIPWQRKKIGRYIKECGISRAAIIRRDFPLKPEEIRKLYKIGESDSRFLIFTSDSDGKRVVIDAEKWYK